MKKSLGAKTLIVPTPVWVIGTYDDEGKPNVMTAAWAGVCCSDPASVSVSLRAATLTHSNITKRKAFTISVPSEVHLTEADYFGIASGRDANKFERAGLTPVPSELVDAPYVAEFPLVLECALSHIVEIGLHTLFVGTILDVKADEECIRLGKYPDIEKVKPFVYSPGSSEYHGIGKKIGKGFSAGRKIG